MLNSKIDSILIPVFIISLTIVGLGAVMVSSSSMAFSDYDYNKNFYHTYSHLLKIVIGISMAFFVYVCGLNFLRRISPVLILLSLFLGGMIFIPNFSVNVNGASRWLNFGGLMFQPYDFIKLGFIIYFSYALSCYKRGYKSELKIAVFFTLLISVLLLLQPDFGSFFLLFTIFMITLFIVFGINRYYFAFIILSIIAFLYLIFSEPYRVERITTFFDPWENRYGSGFQLIQALIAEGNGKLFGVGIGESIQKMLYLPEAHTDFTISVFAEEIGLWGVVLVLLLIFSLYILLIRLSFLLNSHEYYYESYIVFIIASFIVIQSLFNIGVNYGLFPTKGITLPFMGYGGTSIVSHIIMIGMVLAVRRNERISSSGFPHMSEHEAMLKMSNL